MIIYPAIDLKDGQCVRLQQGDMDKVTVFNSDPAQQAAQFEKEGFEWLHVVDLDGAKQGKPVNLKQIKEILDAVSIPVQVGGGLRNLKYIEHWLDAGATRVILGTVALRNPTLVKQACYNFPDKIVVGIDARDGMVSVEGWFEESTTTVRDLALKFEDAGVAAIIYTDINRDGLLKGPDIEGTKALAQALTTPVIASGGISSIEDIKAIKALEEFGVKGVVTGRALYDGRINPQEVLKVA